MSGLKLPETITEEEFQKIIEQVKKSKPKQKLAYCLGFYECMRVSEVCKLQPEDIDYNLKLIWIKQAKGGKDRKVPIAPEVLKGLKHLPINVCPRALQISFRAICKKVTGKNLRFHGLRHSGITHYLTKKRWSSLEVQRLAGHSRIDTTQIYTHINPSDLVNRMWEGDKFT